MYSGVYMYPKKNPGKLTPLLGSTPPLSTASITLPFSSATSLTQSVFPVATSMCVAHPPIFPYSLSFMSISNFDG